MTSRREFITRITAAAVVAKSSISRAQSGEISGDSAKRVANPKKAAQKGARIKSAARRDETILRYGGNGDNWHMSWALDDRQYVSLCDGAGFSNPPKEVHNSRMIAISGGPRDATFHDLPGYPQLARPAQAKNATRYYNFGTLALEGHLYQFLSTFNRAAHPDELDKPNFNDLIRFNGAKLIYSPDNGQHWFNQNGSTPVLWETWGHRSRDTMVFFEEDQEAFSMLTILQMGKNYEQNRDGYVYVYAPNGNTEGTMNELVMFRVLKDRLLDRGSYDYFAGMSAEGDAKWTRDITSRTAVHTFPKGWVNALVHPFAWHPSVVYNAPLGMYMMANWGTGTSTKGMWFGKPSYLGFWVAPNPWGPWTQIHEETSWLPAGDSNARAFAPQIAPKWIAADGKSFWLVWTDFQGYDRKELNPEEGSGGNVNSEFFSEAELIRTVTLTRKYMPFYAFNVQRVDLNVA